MHMIKRKGFTQANKTKISSCCSKQLASRACTVHRLHLNNETIAFIELLIAVLTFFYNLFNELCTTTYCN